MTGQTERPTDGDMLIAICISRFQLDRHRRAWWQRLPVVSERRDDGAGRGRLLLMIRFMRLRGAGLVARSLSARSPPPLRGFQLLQLFSSISTSSNLRATNLVAATV